MTENRLEAMIEKLKEQGYRITPQRLAVLNILAESTEHPDVEKIYKQVKANFPTTSMATVYKTIVVMKEVGELIEIAFSDGSNRYDGHKPYSHPHLICTNCKTIIDPDLDSLKNMTEELVKETGFMIKSHRLDFFGVCPKCQKKEDKKNKGKK